MVLETRKCTPKISDYIVVLVNYWFEVTFTVHNIIYSDINPISLF